MAHVELRDPSESRRFYFAAGCVILIAWGLLAAWQRSAYSEMLDHETAGDYQLPLLLRLAGFLPGWILMIVAMMLPGSLPRLNHSIQPAWGETKNARPAVLLILGYLSPWILFGLLVYLGDSYLHRMAEQGGPLAAHADAIPPALLLAAGLYQITPIKRDFLKRCQDFRPRFLNNQADQGKDSCFLKHGLRLGLICAGSCWAFMLVVFAFGPHRLDWMLALGSMMAAERLSPWGFRLAWLAGFAFIAWAILGIR